MPRKREQRAFGHWDDGKPRKRFDEDVPKRRASMGPPPEFAGASTFHSAPVAPASAPPPAAAPPRRAPANPGAKQGAGDRAPGKRGAQAPAGQSPPPRGAPGRPQPGARTSDAHSGASDGSLRARLELIASRRDERDYLRDPAAPVDPDDPAAAAEPTRASLRYIADQRFAEPDAAELAETDEEEQVWQRVVDLAKPWLSQGDGTAR